MTVSQIAFIYTGGVFGVISPSPGQLRDEARTNAVTVFEKLFLYYTFHASTSHTKGES